MESQQIDFAKKHRVERIAHLRWQMDVALNEPSKLNVAEFDALQREYNILIQQQEADRNLHSARPCVASEREALNRLVSTPKNFAL